MNREERILASPLASALQWKARSKSERQTRESHTAARAVATVVVCALAYAIADLAALSFRLPPAWVPMFVPAAGVGLAAALLRGPIGLAGVALGALVAGIFAPGSPALSVSFGVTLALSSVRSSRPGSARG